MCALRKPFVHKVNHLLTAFRIPIKVQYIESSEVQLHSMNTKPLKVLNIPNSIAGNNKKLIVVSEYSCLDIRHGCNHLFLKWKRLILLVEVVTFTYTCTHKKIV